MNPSQREFHGKLRSSFDHVLIYEQAALQEQARSCIPVEDLQRRAFAKARELGLVKEQLKDLVLIELLDWFKNSFFKWVDAPECDNEQCKGQKPRSIGMTSPLADDLRYDAHRVELYVCDVCHRNIRFPRYNHPGRLLKERRGRCGEWANCFTLCCRALGYDARYVLDWTDHVWTEVYSDNQQRWLHCDPCENVCDKPLLYEAGWKKQLTYVIAFSKDDIQDVTWRYSANHSETLRRRNEVPETFLVGLILRFRHERQRNLDPQKKRFFDERTVRELVELMNPRTSCSEEEQVGRQTGSVEWRTARGELGQSRSGASKGFTIVPTEKELQQKHIQLMYNCSQDLYRRGDDKIVNWSSLLFEAKNVTRKVEHDWNMVYIARTEGASQASITWKVDLKSCDVCVDTVEVEVHDMCYESGRVTWKLQTDNGRTVDVTSRSRCVVTELRDSKVLLLTAKLDGGDGPQAWQHTQLFRQKRQPGVGEDLEWPLNVKINLVKVNS